MSRLTKQELNFLSQITICRDKWIKFLQNVLMNNNVCLWRKILNVNDSFWHWRSRYSSYLFILRGEQNVTHFSQIPRFVLIKQTPLSKSTLYKPIVDSLCSSNPIWHLFACIRNILFRVLLYVASRSTATGVRMTGPIETAWHRITSNLPRLKPRKAENE